MVLYLGNKSSDGVSLGQAATDLVSLYGKTPVAQPSVTAVTDGSTGTAAATNGIAPCTASYNSTILNNSVATLADGINRIRTALVSVGVVA